MTQLGRTYFDACTLENFAAVERLDLLQSLYQGRIAWTDGVEWDVRGGAAERPHLAPLLGAAWLGTPVTTTDPVAVQQIDRIRRALGGSSGLPLQHLGEAQTIHHISTVEPTASFATDDRDAYDLAHRKGLHVIDTPEILARCFDAGLLGCPEAYDLLHKMAAAGRGVAIPDTHWFVCPGPSPPTNSP